MERIRRQIGFSNAFTVNCKVVTTKNDKGLRRAGGLCMLWNDGVVAEMQSFSSNHIDMTVGLKANSLRWRFTGFYGEPKVEDRQSSWNLLRTLSLQGNLPWVVGGDFNEITSNSDKEGGVIRNRRQIEGLVDALDFCELKDVRFTGPRFTWHGLRAGHSIKIRLDRFVATESWLEVFGAAKVVHLLPNKSDHIPIMLEARRENLYRRRRPRIFRYEDCWATEEGCRSIVANAWNDVDDVDPFSRVFRKTNKTREAFKVWSLNCFGYTKRDIDKTKKKLASFFDEDSPMGIDEKLQLETELDTLIHKDMLYWRQRAKEHWLMEGDSNTKYFHKAPTERKKANSLTGLFDAQGVWRSTDDQMVQVALQYFRDLFTTGQNNEMGDVLGCIPRLVSDDFNAGLSKAIDKDEVREALFQMQPTKAPGPDGFSPGFYQKFWDIVGDDVWLAVKSFLFSTEQMKKINNTNICLIPKVADPTNMSQLRPISLCNVLYKIGSKVLATRLKPIMDNIISSSQSAFVPGRLISDNTLLAYEVLHYMRGKRTGRKGFCALKLDMSKAYDRVEWQFLQQIMEKLGFCDEWVQVIMRCITTVVRTHPRITPEILGGHE